MDDRELAEVRRPAAIAAGLRPVFIAHPHTWRLEVVALPENDARILRVTRFRELAMLF